jgi:hypothetical protein|tara:strand:- start:156 stop:401 length:246 start_codon:yes stop_codon:yes gene_type:complete
LGEEVDEGILGAAILTHHDGRYALTYHGPSGPHVAEQSSVVMAVRVDEAGREYSAPTIHDGLTSARRELADLGNSAVDDAH